MLKEPFLLLSI